MFSSGSSLSAAQLMRSWRYGGIIYRVSTSLFYSPSLPSFLVPAVSAVGEVVASLQSVLPSISLGPRLLPWQGPRNAVRPLGVSP